MNQLCDFCLNWSALKHGRFISRLQWSQVAKDLYRRTADLQPNIPICVSAVAQHCRIWGTRINIGSVSPIRIAAIADVGPYGRPSERPFMKQSCQTSFRCRPDKRGPPSGLFSCEKLPGRSFEFACLRCEFVRRAVSRVPRASKTFEPL